MFLFVCIGLFSLDQAGIVSKLMDDDATLRESFENSMSTMSKLTEKLTNLKAKQVQVVASDHIKMICSTINDLMSDSDSDTTAGECSKLRVAIVNHCEKLSLYAACLPEHTDLREEMISVSKFAKILCDAGGISSSSCFFQKKIQMVY